MTTHRSLNKLEFRAHMSIHNFVEIPEGEGPEAGYTRDRFGKRHDLSKADGTGRPDPALPGALLLFFGTLASVFWASPAQALSNRGTDIQVTSSEAETLSLDQRLGAHGRDTDDKPVFYQEGSTRVGFNDDAQPNVSMSF